MISLRDVTSIHNLQKYQQEKALLQKLHLTISKDLVDPLTLIIVSVNWLIRWHKQLKGVKIRSKTKEEALENLYNILIASKLSFFKCKDLLEITA